LKSILQTVVGLFTFGGVVLTPSLVFGLSMSTFGGVWYGVVKYDETINKQQRAAQHNVSQTVEVKTEGGPDDDERSKR
jgi:hypothetical protein